MPKVGSIVKTSEGTGEVFSNNIVKESVKVKLKPKKNLEITKTFITLPTLNKKTR